MTRACYVSRPLPVAPDDDLQSSVAIRQISCAKENRQMADRDKCMCEFKSCKCADSCDFFCSSNQLIASVTISRTRWGNCF